MVFSEPTFCFLVFQRLKDKSCCWLFQKVCASVHLLFLPFENSVYFFAFSAVLNSPAKPIDFSSGFCIVIGVLSFSVEIFSLTFFTFFSTVKTVLTYVIDFVNLRPPQIGGFAQCFNAAALLPMNGILKCKAGSFCYIGWSTII